MRMLPLFLSLALLSGATRSQSFVQPGEIVTASGPFLGVTTATGVSTTPYSTTVSISTVLWDPRQPDSFIVGTGNGASTGGRLIRMTFSSSTQVVSTEIAPTGSFAQPRSLAWDQSGKEVVFPTTWGRLHRVAVGTGVVTDITTGTQPWGSNSTCCAVDPRNGDIWVGTSSGDLYRLAASGGAPVLIHSGLEGRLTDLLVEDTRAAHRLFFVSDTAMGRIDLASAGSPEYFFGTFGTPSNSGPIVSAAFDQNGDILLAENYEVLRIPNVATIPAGGIAPAHVGSVTFSSPGWIRHCTVVGSTTRPFRVIAESPPPLGAHIAVQNTPIGTAFGYTLISTSTLLPVDTGPFFGLIPDILTVGILRLPPTPGNLLAFEGPVALPLDIPTLGMAPFAGQTWDFVSVAFGPSGRYLGRTKVARVTWN